MLTPEHEKFMQRCIELAEVARNKGDAPVGSVVVINDQIVGEGIEQSSLNLSGHAEILACQNAVNQQRSASLHGASLYTTAEPCFMCSYVIRKCGITCVVYGTDTPYAGGFTSNVPVLIDPSLSEWMPPPHVIAGVLRDECERLRRRSQQNC